MPYGIFFRKLDFYTSPSYLILSILQGLKWFYYSIWASAWSYPQGPGQRSLCDDEALLPKVSLTPECGTIPGREAGSVSGSEGAASRCCCPLKAAGNPPTRLSLHSPLLAYGPERADGAVSSGEVWKNFPRSPGEWAVQILLETKERIGSSVFFNPNSFQMTHWESFIQTWIYPKAFLAKPSHGAVSQCRSLYLKRLYVM